MHSELSNDSPSEGSLVGSVFLSASAGAAATLLIGGFGGVVAGTFIGAAAGAALLRWTRPEGRSVARTRTTRPAVAKATHAQTEVVAEPVPARRARSPRSAVKLDELAPEAVAFSGCARALAYSRALIDSERGAPPRVAQKLATLSAGQLEYATDLANLASIWLAGELEPPTRVEFRSELAERMRANQQAAVRASVDLVLDVEEELPNRCRARRTSVFLALELLLAEFVDRHPGGDLALTVSRDRSGAAESTYNVRFDFLGVPCGPEDLVPSWIHGLCSRFEGEFGRVAVEAANAHWRLTVPFMRPKRLTAPTAFVLDDAKGTSVAVAVSEGKRRDVVRDTLVTWELEPLVVASPKMLAAALAKHPVGAVIVCDAWLKHPDVIAALRDRGRSDLIALRSDWASSGLRRFDEGVDPLINAELLTPLDSTKLREQLLNQVRAKVSKSQRIFRPIDERRTTLKVLVAEDNPVNARYVVRLLEKRGYDVVTATDGKLALEMIAEESPDLVLMDVNMPNLDGVSATKQWREIELSQRIDNPLPIIALTAHAEKSERDRCLNAGMTGYITKPIVETQLWDAIARASGMEAADEDEGPLSQPHETVFDERKVLEFVAGDKEFLTSLIELFDQTAPQQVDAIEAALNAGNAQDVERTAHQLKGSVSNFAAKRARELAQELESAGRAGKLDGLAPVLASLRTEVTAISAGLAAMLTVQP